MASNDASNERMEQLERIARAATAGPTAQAEVIIFLAELARAYGPLLLALAPVLAELLQQTLTVATEPPKPAPEPPKMAPEPTKPANMADMLRKSIVAQLARNGRTGGQWTNPDKVGKD